MEKKLYREYATALAFTIIAGGAVVLGVEWQTPSELDPIATIAQTVHEDPFQGLSLEGRGIYVYDIARDAVLFERNAELQLPLASLTKLMTALVAARVLDERSVVTIDAEAILEEGDYGLQAGETWNAETLLQMTLLSSSNDGAHALAAASGFALGEKEGSREHFVKTMNRTAEELGLIQTYFVNESGLDINDDTIAGGYGSARDVAHLMTYLIREHADLLDPTRHGVQSFYSEDGGEHILENTNAAAGRIQGLIAGKTGFTDLAGGNLVIAIDAGLMRPIVIAVLGSSVGGRFSDVERLAQASRIATTQ